jgi:hypothetical protein
VNEKNVLDRAVVQVAHEDVVARLPDPRQILELVSGERTVHADHHPIASKEPKSDQVYRRPERDQHRCGCDNTVRSAAHAPRPVEFFAAGGATVTGLADLGAQFTVGRENGLTTRIG